MPIYLKYLITAALVVGVSEIAKRAEKIGALITALPLISILVMIWLYIEKQEEGSRVKIANYAFYTFWYVLPTLPMFLVMSRLLRKGVSFWLALVAYIVGTLLMLLLLHAFTKKFGINLI